MVPRPTFVREIYKGDPPPADPPNDHCVWLPIMVSTAAWVETDAHFRERIKRTLGDG